jgi:hypothetical protein
MRTGGAPVTTTEAMTARKLAKRAGRFLGSRWLANLVAVVSVVVGTTIALDANHAAERSAARAAADQVAFVLGPNNSAMLANYSRRVVREPTLRTVLVTRVASKRKVVVFMDDLPPCSAWKLWLADQTSWLEYQPATVDFMDADGQAWEITSAIGHAIPLTHQRFVKSISSVDEDTWSIGTGYIKVSLVAAQECQ